MQTYDRKNIRNFSIIAHIDHGKSTIADRLLELTKTLSSREMVEQVLDDMDLERERGITIKAHPVTMWYEAEDGQLYQINFIDTPGHVDFSYEVSRSLAACEGALLVVDAVQGVQAQSLANVHLAIDRGLTIVPVINKVDLPAADPEAVKQQIEDVIGVDTTNSVLASAKSGKGIKEVLEHILHEVPAPNQPEDDILRALVFDSHYDPYRGVLVYVRVISGEITKKSQIYFMASDKTFEVLEVGIFSPNEKPVERLRPGEVGYISCNIKNTSDVKVGETVTLKKYPATDPLPGFRLIAPVVFAGIYPVDSSDFEAVRDALAKLQLNDSALHVEQESSLALGFGFRCGFLGLLHLEIVFERLQREFDLDIITTAPSVVYKFTFTSGEEKMIDNVAQYPDPVLIDFVEEPWVICRIMASSEYLGAIMSLAMEKRGEQINTETMDATRLLLTYRMPLNEIITDFNDKLKSATRGYASLDYNFIKFEPANLVKMDMLINGEKVDALAVIVHRDVAYHRGKALAEKMRELIPRQMFDVAIQAAIGNHIIARQTVKALRKNVTAKCYGGDVTRKRKLLEKQKAGKKRMKQVGSVEIPQEAFKAVFQTDKKNK